MIGAVRLGRASLRRERKTCAR